MFGRLSARQRSQSQQPPSGIAGLVAMPQPRKMTGLERIGVLGGMVSDTFGGSGNASRMQGFVQGRIDDEMQQALVARQQQLITQMTGGAGGAQGGVSPQMQALAQLNPQAFTNMLAANNTNTIVGQGDTYLDRMNGGTFTAPQNFQNGSQIARMNPDGTVTSIDMGMNADNRVDMQESADRLSGTQISSETDRYVADQNLTGTRYNADSRLSGQRLAADTAANRLAFDIEQAEFSAANPTSDLGKNPLYMTDENGNVVIGQLGNGQIVPAQTPEGLSVMSPFERSAEQSRGRSVGKMEGEAIGSLPAATMRAEEAIRTVDALLQHPGLEAGTGADYWRSLIPGTQARAFGAMADQASGQAFLQGFEMLKGAGVITEFEGQRAEQALARMDRAQSADDYRAALRDYRGVIERGLQTARQRAGQGGPQSSGGLTVEEQRELAELEARFGN